jgi:hypothetical protein
MYHVLEEGDDTSDTNTMVTHTAAVVTTGSTLSNTYQASVIPPELTAAINTIVANQQSLYNHIAPLLQQMAALSFQRQPPTQARQPVFQAPPIQHLAIPGPWHTPSIREGTNRGTNKAGVEGVAPGVAATGAPTTGVAVAAPHLLTIWRLKGMDTVAALVPSPRPEAELSALSSPIW